LVSCFLLIINPYRIYWLPFLAGVLFVYNSFNWIYFPFYSRFLADKTVSDIVIFRNAPAPRMFLIEVKGYKGSNNRIGFGTKGGKGIQPEILKKNQNI